MFAAGASSLSLSPPSSAPATEFVKYSLDGKEACFVNVAFDSCSHLLWMVPKLAGGPTPPVISLDLLQLKFVESGNRPRDSSKLKKLLNMQKVAPAQCLSLYFGEWPWKAYHLAYPSSQVTKFWLEKLRTYISTHPTVDFTTHVDTWLHRLYTQLKQSHGDKLHITTVLAAFSRDRIWKGYKLLKDLEKEDPSLASIPEQNPSLSDVKSLYLSYVSTWRQDIRGLYRKYSLPAESTSTDRNLLNPLPEIPVVTPSSRRRSSIAAIAFKAKFPKQSKPLPSAIKLDPNVTMSAEAFATFLKVSQSRQHVGVNEAAAIIAKYDTFTKKRDTDHITLKGFAHYLLAQEASPPPQLPLKQLQKMDQPLSDYMIASSHNTYLTGHQLHGESSVSMYAKVLHSGCRCVELDTWDGEDGEPVIYHGYTLTSKIKFKAVINTISKHAFAASPYPLILSLENHCSLTQQRKMAKYMKEAFGDMLLTSSEQEMLRPSLPTPEELKYKILIKHRKIHNILDIAGDDNCHTASHLFKNYEPSSCTLPGSSKRKASVMFPQPFALSSLCTNSQHASSFRDSQHSSCPNSPRNNTSRDVIRSKSVTPDREITMWAPREIQDKASTLRRTDSNLSMYTIFEDEKPPQPRSFPSPCVSRKLGIPKHGDLEITKLRDSFSKIGVIDTKANKEPPNMSDVSAQHEGADSSNNTPLLRPKLRRAALPGREDTPTVVRMFGHEEPVQQKEVRILTPFEESAKDNTTPSMMTELSCVRSDPELIPPTLSLESTPIAHKDSFLMSDKDSLPQTPRSRALDLKQLTALPLHQQDAMTDTLSVPPTQRRLSSPELGEEMHFGPPSPQRSLSFRAPRFEDSALQRPNSLKLSSFSPQRLPAEEEMESCPLEDEVPVESSHRRDTAEATYDSKDIARELSDMVVYTEPVRFTGFKGQEQRLSEMYSLSENMAKKAIKKTSQDFLNFNEYHLSRIYPSASRISSANYNPAYYWMRGSQMVALNYQTNDSPMQQNTALFKQNAGYGYIPKPKNWKERAEEVLAGVNCNDTQLKITVLSGQHLVSHAGYLPAVEIEVMGIPTDAYKIKLQASSNDEGGAYTQWDNGATMSANVAITAYAVVKFSVFSDKSSSHPLHSHAVPLASLRSGYQHVYFTDSISYELFHPPPSLFVFIQLSGSEVVEPGGELTNSVCVRLSLEESVESNSLTLTLDEPILCEELVARIIQEAGLEGKQSSDYSLYLDEHLVDSSALLEPNTEHLELRDAVSQSQDLPQLAMVPIYYSDLAGVDSDFITLFADNTTTAKDLIAGSVARLGNELSKVYPHLEGTEDEEELSNLFCFVYACNNDDTFKRREVLRSDALVLQMFSDEDSNSCLLLHTKDQDHQLEPSGSAPISNTDITDTRHLTRDTSAVEMPTTKDFMEHCAPCSPDHISSSSTVHIMADSPDGESQTMSPNNNSDNGRPISIRYVSPEVAQRNLEEYFKNVQLRVNQEQRRRRREGKGQECDLETGICHSVYGEFFMEEPQGGAVSSQKEEVQLTGKVKKTKRWFKKFGSRSLDRQQQRQDVDTEKRLEPFGEGKKVMKSPKPRKRWTFGSTKSRTLYSSREFTRSQSLHHSRHRRVATEETKARKEYSINTNV